MSEYQKNLKNKTAISKRRFCAGITNEEYKEMKILCVKHDITIASIFYSAAKKFILSPETEIKKFIRREEDIKRELESE